MLAAADFFANLARAQVHAAVDSVDGRRFAYARRSTKGADFTTQTLTQSLHAGAVLRRQSINLVADRLINSLHLLNQARRSVILFIEHQYRRNFCQLRQRQQLICQQKAEIRRSTGKGCHKQIQISQRRARQKVSARQHAGNHPLSFFAAAYLKAGDIACCQRKTVFLHFSLYLAGIRLAFAFYLKVIIAVIIFQDSALQLCHVYRFLSEMSLPSQMNWTLALPAYSTF